MDYPAEWLDRTPQFANPIAATQVSAACAKLLEDHKWSYMSRRVYAELTRTPGRFPSIDEIAAAVHARTLRRRLNEEGTTPSGTAGELCARPWLSTTCRPRSSRSTTSLPPWASATPQAFAMPSLDRPHPQRGRAGAGTAGAKTG